MTTFAIRRDEHGDPVALEADGFTLLHLVPSERTVQFADKIVSILNNAERAAHRLQSIMEK